jgi:hypothetical protein
VLNSGYEVRERESLVEWEGWKECGGFLKGRAGAADYLREAGLEDERQSNSRNADWLLGPDGDGGPEPWRG